MSCSSGSAFHNLCASSCPTSGLCDCRVRSAFSCRPLCPCPILQVNKFVSEDEIRVLMCDYVASTGCTGVFVGRTAFVTCLGTTGWPAFGCPVEIGVVADGTADPITPIATVVNGVATISTVLIPVSLDGLYNLTVDSLTCNPPVNVEFIGA